MDKIMTTSLPGPPAVGREGSPKTELEKIGARLDKFVKRRPATVTPGSSPSRLPKPEISPKPAHLVAQLTTGRPKVGTAEKCEKPNSTTSMLKSTLKRMTKLASPPSNHAATKSLSRSSSIKSGESEKRSSPPPAAGGHRTASMNRSSSLRKAKSKEGPAMTSSAVSSYSLSRSGTSGNLDRMRRTPSMNSGRRFRDRDLNVKRSRGVQTQLTKDTVDEPDVDDAGNMPTQVEFNVYLPDLFGGDTDHVETHISEPTEPVDVRKNRQLTLDNMRLHRELEKLKQGANEHEMVKKDLRNVRSKLEEEQKLRAKIESQLDGHNQKVREIAVSMDNVEREFERRDAVIAAVEDQIGAEKVRTRKLEGELASAAKVIERQRADLAATKAAYKALMDLFEHTESEAKDLQEFLHAEKSALGETLRDSEAEVARLTAAAESKSAEVKEAEERCGHLVRLGEQRHQEALTCQHQLVVFKEQASEILMAQGVELSQAFVQLGSICQKIEARLGGENSTPKAKCEAKSESQIREEILATFDSLQQQTVDKSSSLADSLQNLSLAIQKRRKSEHAHFSPSNRGGDTSTIVDIVSRLDGLVSQSLSDKTATPTNGYLDQNDINALNKCNRKDEKAPPKINGTDTIEDMKAKFVKHQQIYISNYEQAELEIERMDEIYHETVERVVRTLKELPDVIDSHPKLGELVTSLQQENSLSSLVSPEDKLAKKVKMNLETPQLAIDNNGLNLSL